MDQPGIARPSPHVIRVPPPEGLTSQPLMLVTLAALLVSGVVCGPVLIAVGVTVAAWLVWPGVAALAALGILAVWWPRRNARCEQRRQAYLARLRQSGEDPLVPGIAERWQSSKGVSDDDVRTVLTASTTSDSPRAAVVCLGQIDVPEVGELFFEPEIITPTGYMGRRLIFIPIAAALIFVWVLQKIGVLPVRIVPLGGFSYLLWMGAAVAGAWVWRSAIRPTYIRMAPGIIQILQYRYRRAKPLIRSYPMDGETLAILRGKATGKKGHNLRLTLLRGERKDTVDLSRMRKREEVAERVWQALLSTAPTPPLSDEELVG